MAIKDITREAVLAAVTEYEQVGRDRFLRRLGLKPPGPAFVVIHEEKVYDPHALVSFAHRHDGLGDLDAAQLKGHNVKRMRAVLDGLGFIVADGRVEKCFSCWGRADWIIKGHDRWERPWEPISECGPCAEKRNGSSGVSRAASYVMGRYTQKVIRELRKAPPQPRPRLIAGEALKTRAFARQATAETTGERREAELCARYTAWLGRPLGRWEILLGPGIRPLSTDLYDEKAHELYEAKGDVTRESIRMAIGELQDYRRSLERERPGLKLAVLLPQRPDPDLVDLVLSQGYALVHEDQHSGGFQRLTPAEE